MSLADKQALLRLISEYSKAQEELISKVNFLNPEPEIIECSKQFASFPEPEWRLTRTIQWCEIRSGYYETNPDFYYERDFVAFPLDTILEDISIENLPRYFKKDNSQESHRYICTAKPSDGQLLAFKILEIHWYIRLWDHYNRYVPTYAPHHLSSGIVINLNADKGIKVAFQDVDKEIWCDYEINSTRVVPATIENLKKVLAFHSQYPFSKGIPKEK